MPWPHALCMRGRGWKRTLPGDLAVKNSFFFLIANPGDHPITITHHPQPWKLPLLPLEEGCSHAGCFTLQFFQICCLYQTDHTCLFSYRISFNFLCGCWLLSLTFQHCCIWTVVLWSLPLSFQGSFGRKESWIYKFAIWNLKPDVHVYRRMGWREARMASKRHVCDNADVIRQILRFRWGQQQWRSGKIY